MDFNSSPQPIIFPVASEGIALIDKSSGVSSHYVVNHLRHRFNLKRVGHSGTLDPLATGLLICLLGRNFTKLQDQFLKQPKVYVCDFSLGFTTDTYDRTGRETSRANWTDLKKISQTQVKTLMATMTGSQNQIVPAFSAVKIQGKKLYQKALHETNFDLATLPSRKVTISDLVLEDWRFNDLNQTLTGSIKIACSSGTYVRSLIHDLGQKLEVGGCVMELRRLSIGPWSVKTANQISAPTIALYQKISDLPKFQ